MTDYNTFTLDGFDCNDRSSTFLVSLDLGEFDVAADIVIGDRMKLRQGIPSITGPRIATAVVRLEAASADALETLYADLRSHVPGLGDADEVDAVVGRKRRSYTATLKVKRSKRPSNDVGVLYAEGQSSVVQLTLSCEPYLRGTVDTLYNAAAATLPAVKSLSAMVGDGHAPLDLLADFGALHAAAFFAGRYPDASAAISDFAIEAAGLSWSGGAAAADSAGYPDGSGNTLWSNQSASEVHAAIDVTAPEPGEYRIVAKCKGTTADAATIWHDYCEPTEIPGTSLGLLSLGTVRLPCSAVRGSATSSLRLYIAGDGTNYAYVNAVFLIPVSWGGMVGWQVSSGYAGAIASEDDVLYADDAGDNGNSAGGRQIIGKGGALVLLAEQSTPQPTTAADLTVSYEPLWEQLPAS